MSKTPPVVPPADALRALSRALHGVVAPLLAHGAVELPSPIVVRSSDGEAHPIAPASDVWTQQGANEPLRAATADAVEFDLANTGILAEVKHALFPEDKESPTAELLGLDVLESGGRVEPRANKGDGTLLLLLPSRFFGGELVTAHRGAIDVLRWGTEIESDPDPRRLRWAAISASVKHTVERVRQGSRCTLVFALHRHGAAPAAATDDKTLTEVIRQALRALRPSIEAGAVLAVPCERSYLGVTRFQTGSDELEPQDDELLSGRDARLAAAAHVQGLRVRIRPYLLDIRSGERWRLRGFVEPSRAPGASEDRATILRALTVEGGPLGDGQLEETFAIDPPQFTGVPRRYELDARTPRALYEGLPAVDPAPVNGVVRADSAAAALYTYAALVIDRDPATAAKKPAAEPKPEPKPEKPAPAVEPKAKAESKPKAEPKAKTEPKAKAKASAEKKPKPKAETKASSKAETRPEPKAKASAEKKPKPKITSADAIGGVRKGIAAVLARLNTRGR